ncbi:heterokaryon incompatibility protein-domain-containing protein [Lasiosphaeria miniovina]|uniref:Heterokaryon incompatibility protein-domain-containing protein n=1 Tax=Lasiosphaeria miniovina TaxID=1954250 RepID=A0AA40AK59_9PEZI|nr:heterokaryon incompatibility protein-domain-containing protein [Lasiosphaeria miniovina]KAK0717328.1 heterokaryon incompatibility protein-domain-containing protein [Lasiosphaeria miniovina]
MLSRRGRREYPHQPPRSHRSNGKLPKKGGLCRFCTQHVFTAALLKGLQDASSSSQLSGCMRHEIGYSRKASALSASIFQGCPWCACAGNGILHSEHLDDVLLPRSREGEHDEFPQVTLDDLSCGAVLDFKLEFLQSEPGAVSGVFDQIKARIEVTSDRHKGGWRCRLPDMKGEDAVMLTFEVIDSSDSADTTPRRIFPRRLLLPKFEDTWLPTAVGWLQTCKGSHKTCDAQHHTFQPERLIMVRGRPLIVQRDATKEDVPVQYTTLSYVWGAGQTYVLTQSSLDEMCQGLDETRLPRTIADAIDVTRRLGYDYLWVDALCIVQDSPADKATQLPMMGDIYRNCALTIVAANSAAATEGFLRAPDEPDYYIPPFAVPFSQSRPRSQSRSQPQAKAKAKAETPASLQLGFRYDYKPWKDPINDRAWTLQERVLSARSLVFSYDGVKWVCREQQTNPSAPADAPPPFPHLLKGGGIPTGPRQEEYRKIWLALREEYNRRKLTNAADKFPAVSAIVSEVTSKTGWTYVAGLWKEHLLVDLHWHRHPVAITRFLATTTEDPLLPRPTPRVAPTWSWASCGGGVISGAEMGGAARALGAFHFRILSVTDSALAVRGRMVEREWKEAGAGALTDGYLVRDARKQMWEEESGYPIGTLDVLDPGMRSGRRIHCLAMSKEGEPHKGAPRVEGLMLVPSLGSGSGLAGRVFERVGYFEAVGDGPFGSAEEVELQIV